MKALITDNMVVDVSEETFEVSSSGEWMDCPDECKIHEWILEDGVLKERSAPVFSESEIAQAEIQRLEGTVTPRRIREMTTEAGKDWVDAVEAAIAVERAKL